MYSKSQPCELCGSQGASKAPYPRLLTWISLLANALLVLALSKLLHREFSTTCSVNNTCIRPQLTNSPGSDHTTYERRRLYRILENNPYTGDPREEFDRAWGELIAPIVVQITPEEYASAQLPDSSLALSDGSGYLAEMAVYHELHCIKRVRQHLHMERYHPNLTSSEREREEFHVDHCLEYWREAAMCRADPTLTTMFWRDGVPTSRHYDDHECVNWERFDGWARSRIFNISDFERLDQTGRWDLISNEHGETLSES